MNGTGNGHANGAAATLTAPEPQKREIRVVQDESAVSYLMDTARFEHLFRIAGVMAISSLVPEHLRGESLDQTKANCFRVVNQAIRWGVDPFALVDCTYVVKGKLGYEGKLVASVVNTRAGLKERLQFTYSGAGNARTVTVIGTFVNEREPRTIELSVMQARTNNEMWVKDPDQKLVYSGVTKWARRHCPEVLLGVLTDDDLERMFSIKDVSAVDVTSKGSGKVQVSALNSIIGESEKTIVVEAGGEKPQADETEAVKNDQKQEEEVEPERADQQKAAPVVDDHPEMVGLGVSLAECRSMSEVLGIKQNWSRGLSKEAVVVLNERCDARCREITGKK